MRHEWRGVEGSRTRVHAYPGEIAGSSRRPPFTLLVARARIVARPMRIHVADVALRQRCTFVTFVAEGSLAIAQWAAGVQAPDIDVAYDVELDITDTVALGKNASPAPDRSASLAAMSSQGEHTTLFVDVERIDEGVLVGRLGASLILLELDERRPYVLPTAGMRLRVHIPSRQLVLTPIGAAIR